MRFRCDEKIVCDQPNDNPQLLVSSEQADPPRPACDERIVCYAKYSALTGGSGRNDDYPVMNISSEKPDSDIFFDTDWGDPDPPGPGRWELCFGWCVSTVSLAEAQACADALEELCAPDGPEGFTNSAQTCTLPCVDGGNYTFTVAAGLFFGYTQKQADDTALAFACAKCNYQALLDGRTCGQPPKIEPELPTYYNTDQVCYGTCANGDPYYGFVRAGSYAAGTQELANRIAYGVACAIARANVETQCIRPIITSPPLDRTICKDMATHLSLTAQGGFPLEWSFDPALPDGLVDSQSADSKTLYIDGSATALGSSTIKVTVTNRIGQTAEQDMKLTVVGISTPSPLGNGKNAAAYSATLQSEGLGDPVTWSIIGGALPTGLSLNSTTGVISGTPWTVGDFSFTVQAAGKDHTCAKDFTIHINPSDFFASFNWPFVTAQCGGSASGSGATAQASAVSCNPGPSLGIVTGSNTSAAGATLHCQMIANVTGGGPDGGCYVQWNDNGSLSYLVPPGSDAGTYIANFDITLGDGGIGHQGFQVQATVPWIPLNPTSSRSISVILIITSI